MRGQLGLVSVSFDQFEPHGCGVVWVRGRSATGIAARSRARLRFCVFERAPPVAGGQDRVDQNVFVAYAWDGPFPWHVPAGRALQTSRRGPAKAKKFNVFASSSLPAAESIIPGEVSSNSVASSQ